MDYSFSNDGATYTFSISGEDNTFTVDSTEYNFSVAAGNIEAGFVPLEGEGITLTPSGSDFIFSVTDYISKTEVADVSSGLQDSIDNIDIIAGENIEVVESPSDSWTISLSASPFLDFIEFNSDYSLEGHVEGRLFYDSQDKTIALQTDVDGTVLQIGQEQFLRIINKSESQIDNGDVVYISGSFGGKRPTVDLASNNAGNYDYVIGVATADIPVNNNGYITTFGLVRDLDTSAYADGTKLWLGLNGKWTDVEPTAPNHKVRVGFVIFSDSSKGVLLCSIDTGSALKDLHDVEVANVSAGDLLTYNGTYWDNDINLYEYVTLQNAYENGNTITTDSSAGDFTVIGNVNISDGDLYIDGLPSENAGNFITWDASQALVDSGTSINDITLQNAYENGNTITTDSSAGDVIINGTEPLVLNQGISSTDSSTGSIVVSGGVGVSENIGIGGYQVFDSVIDIRGLFLQPISIGTKPSETYGIVIGTADIQIGAGDISDILIGQFTRKDNTVVARGLAIGTGAACDGWSTTLGNNASSVPFSCAIGYSANASDQDAVVIGYSAGVPGNNKGTGSVVIGRQALASSATGDANYGIAIGYMAMTKNTNSVAIGRATETTAIDQIMLGNDNYFDHVYIPMTTDATSPSSGSLQVVGGAGIQGRVCIKDRPHGSPEDAVALEVGDTGGGTVASFMTKTGGVDGIALVTSAQASSADANNHFGIESLAGSSGDGNTGTMVGVQSTLRHGGGAGQIGYGVRSIINTGSAAGAGSVGYAIRGETGSGSFETMWAGSFDGNVEINDLYLRSLQIANAGNILTWDSNQVLIDSGTKSPVTTESSATSSAQQVLDTSSETTVEWLVSIKSGSNVRTSKILAATDGSSVEFNEYFTNDLGDTSVALSVDYSGGMRLLATISDANTWTIKTKREEL